MRYIKGISISYVLLKAAISVEEIVGIIPVRRRLCLKCLKSLQTLEGPSRHLALEQLSGRRGFIMPTVI